MSTLYEVKAEKVDGLTAVLDVRVVHPDAMQIPADTSFALMILRESSGDDDALAKEVAFEDTLDESWVKKFGKGFVRDVTVRDMKGEGTMRMRARLVVTVTHAAWIAHLKPGASWDSTAFEVTRAYDDHAPIAPSAPKRVANDEEDAMFVWVPRECFMFGDFGFAMPPLLRMPAYAASCYAAGDAWKKSDDWIGEAVIAGSRAGVLGSLKSDWAMVVDFTHGARGAFGVNPSELRRAIPKAGRRGTRMSYREVMQAAATTVSNVTKHGDTIELEIRIPPDGRALPFATETDAFQILFAPLVVRGRIGEFVPSELTNALVADLAEREMEGAHRIADIRAEIAKKYVRSFTLERPASYAIPNLDAMTPSAAYDALSGPWPTATLRIVASDPKWIAHLDRASYASLSVEDGPLEPPREPAPKIALLPIARPDARAVLWCNTGTSDKIWMIERFGKTLKTRYGRRRDKHRTEKSEIAKDEATAIKTFDKALAKKTREGYKAPFTTEEAVAVVKDRLGVVLDELAVMEVVARTKELRPKDEIEQIMTPDGPVDVHVVEELAIATIDVPRGATVWLNYRRPATGVWTGAQIEIG